MLGPHISLTIDVYLLSAFLHHCRIWPPSKTFTAGFRGKSSTVIVFEFVCLGVGKVNVSSWMTASDCGDQKCVGGKMQCRKDEGCREGRRLVEGNC